MLSEDPKYFSLGLDCETCICTCNVNMNMMYMYISITYSIF